MSKIQIWFSGVFLEVGKNGPAILVWLHAELFEHIEREVQYMMDLNYVGENLNLLKQVGRFYLYCWRKPRRATKMIWGLEHL